MTECRISFCDSNNTKAKYLYDNVMQRLKEHKLYDNAGNIIFHKEYEYDNIGNIASQENSYNFAGNSYAYKNYYGYDEDNRLTIAHGNTTLPYYALKMEYSPAGRILQKDFYSDILFGSNTVNTSNAFYSNSYDYDSPNPYAVTEAGSDVFCWDDLGNMTKKQYGQNLPELMYWTEDNRMQAYNNIQASKSAFYRYDASGQRELKLTGELVDIDVMNNKHKTANYNNAVLYAGNLMTIDKSGYKKHYFIENERFLTVIGGGKKGAVLDVNTVLTDIVLLVPGRPVAYNGAAALSTNFTTFVREYYINDRNQCATSVTSARSSYALDWYSDFAKNFPSLPQALNKNFIAGIADVPYYWHSDYLGSGSAITNSAGNAVQILDYAPFGEDLLDLNNGYYNEAYQFAGYLKDAESGMNYANARYYNQTTSFFITTDPMWDKYPSHTPYHYCLNNPISFTDPTGMWIPDDDGNLVAEKGDNAATLAKYQDIKYSEALNQLKEQGYNVNDKGILNLKVGDKVTLDNVFTRNLASDGNLQNGDPQLKYNCWGSALFAADNQEINTCKDRVGLPTAFDNTLMSDFVSVSPSEAQFGKTVIRFAESNPYADPKHNALVQSGSASRNPNAVGGTSHGVVYYGTSNDGIVYVYSKNGWDNAPRIMKLQDVKGYGTVTGLGTGTGYYNKK
jgi:RHS repeat-associated protein